MLKILLGIMYLHNTLLYGSQETSNSEHNSDYYKITEHAP